LTAHSQAFGANENVLWNFNYTDGANPYAGSLIMDKSGNLYGTTQDGGAYTNPTFINGGGTVFELTSEGVQSVLRSFGNGMDGGNPKAGLIMDKSGNLYGTTAGGGTLGFGTVFELSPPLTSGGKWTESILWNFGTGSVVAGRAMDGVYPYCTLIVDKSGNLYGTTNAGGPYLYGTVFKLAPPSIAGGDWEESILWNFGKGADGRQPVAGLIRDSSGNLYGTTITGGDNPGYGTVFEISATLNAAPSTLNFGGVKATTTSRPKTVTLRNDGTVPAVIAHVTATAPFKLGGGTNTCSGKTIAPTKTCSFHVEFAPTMVGEVTGGSIDVAYNGSSPAIALEGDGIPVKEHP